MKTKPVITPTRPGDVPADWVALVRSLWSRTAAEELNWRACIAMAVDLYKESIAEPVEATKTTKRSASK